MTREEAIKELTDLLPEEFLSEYVEAIRMAIKVLEQEPCDDAISRQAVLDALDKSKYSNEFCEEHHIDWSINLGMAHIVVNELKPVTPMQQWISVKERLPETDNKNSINKYNVLLWVADKSHSEREPQIYLGKLKQVCGDDGSGNFWGIETKPCDWTIWGWCYINEPDVRAWMPLPESYKEVMQNEN